MDVHNWVLKVTTSCVTAQQLQHALRLMKLYNERYKTEVGNATMDELRTIQLKVGKERNQQIAKYE